MPIQVSFSTDNLTPEEARWIASLVQPRKVGASEFLGAPFGGDTPTETIAAMLETPGATLEVNNGEPKIVLAPVALAEETVEEHIAEFEQITGFTALIVDRNGLPWDERIHASSKALNADGSWRTKRGVDKALVASVEAELRVHEQNLSASDDDLIAQAKPIELPAAAYAPEVQLPVEAQEAKTETVVPPPPPPAPPAPIFPVPSNPTLPGTSPFVALMKRVTTAQGAGKLTQPRVKELLESLDKKSIMDLRTDEDALASFAVLLDGEGV